MKILAPVHIVGLPGVGRRTALRAIFGTSVVPVLKVEDGNTQMFLRPIVLPDGDQVPESSFGVLGIYDITKMDSFNHCSRLVKETQVPLKAVIGTHRDCAKNRKITYDQGIALKTEIDGVWGEMGLKDEFNATQVSQKIKIRAMFAFKQQVLARQHSLAKVPESVLDGDESRVPEILAHQICTIVPDREFEGGNVSSPFLYASRRSASRGEDASSRLSSHSTFVRSKETSQHGKSPAISDQQSSSPMVQVASAQEKAVLDGLALRERKTSSKPRQMAGEFERQVMEADDYKKPPQTSGNKDEFDNSILQQSPQGRQEAVQDQEMSDSMQLSRRSPPPQPHVSQQPSTQQSTLDIDQPEVHIEKRGSTLYPEHLEYAAECDTDAETYVDGLAPRTSRLVEIHAPETLQMLDATQVPHIPNPQIVVLLNTNPLRPTRKLMLQEQRKRTAGPETVRVPLAQMVSPQPAIPKPKAIKSPKSPKKQMMIESVASSKQAKPDFILEVEIGNDVRRLPVRCSDDAYQLASQFVYENHLPVDKIKNLSLMILERAQAVMRQKGEPVRKNRGKVLFKFQLEIEHETYSIAVKEDDDLSELAERFCDQMHIDKPRYLDKIRTKIEQSAEAWRQQASQW